MNGIYDHPAVKLICRGCGKEIDRADAEACTCGKPLCADCWYSIGRCKDCLERLGVR